jgi:dTMP kinase
MTEGVLKRSGNGLFLNFEGIDGCGKSTQKRLLADRLRSEGHNVLETEEPGGTPIGKQIRAILLDSGNQELSATSELLLYFACRAQNVEQWIAPALERGQIVLTDRFTDSTIAYQAYGRGLGEEVVSGLDRIACRGIAPDLTFLFDIDLETSMERARSRNRSDRMDSQAMDFYQRVREGYRTLAAREAVRFCVIVGRAPIPEVASQVWRAVEGRLR